MSGIRVHPRWEQAGLNSPGQPDQGSSPLREFLRTRMSCTCVQGVVTPKQGEAQRHFRPEKGGLRRHREVSHNLSGDFDSSLQLVDLHRNSLLSSGLMSYPQSSRKEGPQGPAQLPAGENLQEQPEVHEDVRGSSERRGRPSLRTDRDGDLKRVVPAINFVSNHIYREDPSKPNK